MSSVVIEYKCPCCGGSIEFDSSIQKMKCPYCDTEFEMETLKSYDEAVKSDRPDNLEWNKKTDGGFSQEESDSMRVYVCKSCGGEIVGDSNMGAASCPYCSSPAKPFLPKVFKSQNHIDEIKGIYVPFWLFSAKTDADIRYRATRVRAWSDSRYRYTETQFFSVLRSGEISFDAVPVDGSSKMPDDLMESIEPYHLSDAVDFQTAYLSGYFADKYDVSAKDNTARANERIRNSTVEMFADTVRGYATVTPEHTSVRFSESSQRYALYPVWLLNTNRKICRKFACRPWCVLEVVCINCRCCFSCYLWHYFSDKILIGEG